MSAIISWKFRRMTMHTCICFIIRYPMCSNSLIVRISTWIKSKIDMMIWISMDKYRMNNEYNVRDVSAILVVHDLNLLEQWKTFSDYWLTMHMDFLNKFKIKKKHIIHWNSYQPNRLNHRFWFHWVEWFFVVNTNRIEGIFYQWNFVFFYLTSTDNNTSIDKNIIE